MQLPKRKTLWLIGAGLVIIVVIIALIGRNSGGLPQGIVAANGRIEATETNVSSLSAGRISRLLVREGDFVTRGQELVLMDTTQLEAQMRQAQASERRAVIGVATAESQVTQAEAEVRSAEAGVEKAQSEQKAAEQRLTRARQLAAGSTVSQQTLDDAEATAAQAAAGVAAAQASQAAAEAGASAAKAAVVDAKASVDAAQAEIDAIQASLDDAVLTAPMDGRVQYLIAQEGEVVASGSRILNLVSLTDVYMTVFLPTPEAGRLQIGSDVRIVLDAAPNYAIPANVSFVADVAQFTPKAVETQDEREKLMFRVRAQIPSELLAQYSAYVKTGLPGMAYLRIDPAADWPAVAVSSAEPPPPAQLAPGGNVIRADTPDTDDDTDTSDETGN